MSTPAQPLATQQPPKFDLTTAVKDPDFLKAPPHEKVAFLSAHDPDFAQAHPADQGAYLAHLLGSDQKTQFEKDRPGEGITSKGAGGAAWDAVKSIVGNLWQGAKKSFSTGDEYASPAEYVAKQDAANAERQAQDEARKKAGYSPFYRAAAQAGAPVDPARMERHAERGEGGAILGEAGVGIGATVLPGVAKRVAKPFSNAIAKTFRTPEGEVRPEVYEPKQLIKTAADKIIPKTAEQEAAQAKAVQDAAYEQKAQDLERRGRQQEAIDRKARIAAKGEAAADAEARKAVPLTQSPYYAQNQATAEAAAEARKPVPVTQSPYYAANKAAAEATAKAESEARQPVPVTESPYWQQNRVKAAATAKAAKAAPVIATPSSEGGGPRFTGHEGRPATWTNERVMQLAKEGNREAIQQAVRRGMELPPNARYVAGDADFSSGAYNPRDVTTFGPDGTPIRQGGRVSAVAKPFSGAKGAMPDLSNVPDVELVEHGGARANASGEPGGGGLEEQARLESEAAQGVKYFRETPGGGRQPLTGVGRQDLRAGPGQKIIRVEANGRETVLDAQPIRPASEHLIRKKPQ